VNLISKEKMFGVIYQSREDRERLVELTESLPAISTNEERILIDKEINEIRGKAKPLHECNIEECIELKKDLFDKFDKLNRSGKFNMAQTFKQMIRSVENHMRVTYLKMNKDAEEEKVKEDELKKEQPLVDNKSKKSKPKGSNRWMVNID
jgi:hypothetical protein